THPEEVAAAAFSPDGRTIVTGCQDRLARLWDRGTGQLLAVLRGHREWIEGVAFSPDGRTVVTGSWDHTARLWGVAPRLPLDPVAAPAGRPLWTQVAFSPDRTTVLTAGGNLARLWDTATGRPIGAPLRHRWRVHALAFSPDGRRVATSSH